MYRLLCCYLRKLGLWKRSRTKTPEVAESAQQVPDAIAKIQAMVRRYVPEGHSLVDELIADRRAEAERE
jgi:hypothetical protein